MNERPRPRLVYVLPRYDPDTGSHFFHLYELLGRAAVVLDIFVVVEKAGSERIGLPFRAYRQRCSWPPLRALELIAVLTWQRFAGRRYFYTHYSFYGAIVSWLVATLFGGRAYYWNAGMPWNYRRPWFAEAVFRFILRHTVLVTGTAGLAREYQRRYGVRPERTRVVPNWVNVARFQPTASRKESRQRLGIPLAAKVVLFTHRLSRRKGAHLIPEIAAEVIRLRGEAGLSVDERPARELDAYRPVSLDASADSAKRQKDVMFVVVGDGPERQNLESRILNQGLERYVRIIGEVPHRELPAYYRVADVLLMPSEEEGFPHVLLESMAAGVPYVASDIGGVREITPPALQEYLVASGDPAPCAEKIIQLLQTAPSERSRISRELGGWVMQYDLALVQKKFVQLFS